ncbi:hypothetical protein [Hymenobacter volaticus]|uniref:Uncharacterized protein n=1 Tax=Hymenobacter volaticus TaxID=2932254 RepID=A0ABY4GDQ7_9BACT|nr:hypothetical protein [Hymenobacter volaticus]UOQ68987.1 hypothetical protein MUN86_26135 [Hymenobacter volaticus]
MDNRPSVDFNRVSDFITQTLAQVKAQLEEDTAGFVRHYLDHAEYEMVFEGLFIGIMKLPYRPAIDLATALTIASDLRLDQEAMYDAFFFNNLCTYAAH